MSDTVYINSIKGIEFLIGKDKFDSILKDFIKKEFGEDEPKIRYYQSSYDDYISDNFLLEKYIDYINSDSEETFNLYFQDACYDEFDSSYLDYFYNSLESSITEKLIPSIRDELNRKGYIDVNFDDNDLLTEIEEKVQDEGVYLEWFDEVKPRDIKINIGISTAVEQNYDHGLIQDMISCYYGRDVHTGSQIVKLTEMDIKEAVDICNNGLSYLVQQQGYSLKDVFTSTPQKGFSESIKEECDNFFNYMGRLTILSKVDYDTFCELATITKQNDHSDKHSKGTVIIDKKCMLGIFNEWHGSGSILEIDLDKDFEIPAKYISSVQIESRFSDKRQGYTVDSVYGLVGSAWREGTSINLKSEKDGVDLDALESDINHFKSQTKTQGKIPLIHSARLKDEDSYHDNSYERGNGYE